MEPLAIVALVLGGILAVTAVVAAIASGSKSKESVPAGSVRSQAVVTPDTAAQTATVSGATLPMRREAQTTTPLMARPPRVRIGESHPYSPIVARRIMPSAGDSLRVRPRLKSLWEEKGWRRSGNAFDGMFHTAHTAWRGHVEIPYRGNYKATIWNPPITALFQAKHPQRYCFQSLGSDGRYNIHFHNPPSSLDHAIVNIESILQDVSA